MLVASAVNCLVRHRAAPEVWADLLRIRHSDGAVPALTDHIAKLADEKTYQDLKEVFPSPPEIGNLPAGDVYIESDRKHVDEPLADGTDGPFGTGICGKIDLGQNFQRAAIGGDHSNDLASTNSRSAMAQNTRTALTPKRRSPGDRGDTIRCPFRDAVVAVAIA